LAKVPKVLPNMRGRKELVEGWTFQRRHRREISRGQHRVSFWIKGGDPYDEVGPQKGALLKGRWSLVFALHPPKSAKDEQDVMSTEGQTYGMTPPLASGHTMIWAWSKKRQ